MAQLVLNSNYTKLLQDLDYSLIDMMKMADEEINADEVTPFRTGATQNDVIIQGSKNRVMLQYTTDYSEKIYYHPEINFRTTYNSNAQALWLEDYINNPAFWVNLFAISMKSRGY
jgi:hypothetical protein